MHNDSHVTFPLIGCPYISRDNNFSFKLFQVVNHFPFFNLINLHYVILNYTMRNHLKQKLEAISKISNAHMINN